MDSQELKEECNRLIDRVIILQKKDRELQELTEGLLEEKERLLSQPLKPIKEEGAGSDSSQGTEGGQGPNDGHELEESRLQAYPAKAGPEENRQPLLDGSLDASCDAAGGGLAEAEKTSAEVPAPAGHAHPPLPEAEEDGLKRQMALLQGDKEIIVVYGRSGVSEALKNLLKAGAYILSILFLTVAAAALLYCVGGG